MIAHAAGAAAAAGAAKVAAETEVARVAAEAEAASAEQGGAASQTADEDRADNSGAEGAEVDEAAAASVDAGSEAEDINESTGAAGDGSATGVNATLETGAAAPDGSALRSNGDDVARQDPGSPRTAASAGAAQRAHATATVSVAERVAEMERTTSKTRAVEGQRASAAADTNPTAVGTQQVLGAEADAEASASSLPHLAQRP